MQTALDIIERAKRKKIDSEIVALNKDIEIKTQEVDLLKKKEQSAKIQLEQDTKRRDALRKSICELQALKSHIPEDDYKLASDELTRDTNAVEVSIHNDYNNLKTIRNEMETAQATISQRADRLRTLAGPNAVKNLFIQYVPETKPDEFFFAQARAEIQDLFNGCNRIERDLQGKDTRIILLNATIMAAKVRRYSDKPDLNAAEKIILYRAMGRIIVLGKNTPCYIDCISKTVNEDWDLYVEAKQKELWEYERMMEKRREIAATNAAIASMEPQEVEQEEDFDQVLMLELAERRVIDKTRGLRVTIFGGVLGDKRGMEWIQDALQLGKLNICNELTDRSVSSVADSLKNRGVDLLVIITKWMAHSKFSVAIDTAKKNKVGIVNCNSSSKRAIIRAIADSLCPANQEAVMAK